MSWLDIALLCAVALALGLAVRKVHRDRKRGKTCCGDCARCAASGRGCPHG